MEDFSPHDVSYHPLTPEETVERLLEDSLTSLRGEGPVVLLIDPLPPLTPKETLHDRQAKEAPTAFDGNEKAARDFIADRGTADAPAGVTNLRRAEGARTRYRTSVNRIERARKETRNV